jgi:hypothetical protein
VVYYVFSMVSSATLSEPDQAMAGDGPDFGNVNDK